MNRLTNNPTPTSSAPSGQPSSKRRLAIPSDSKRADEIAHYLEHNPTTLEDRIALMILARRNTTGKRLRDIGPKQAAIILNDKFIPAYMSVFGIDRAKETTENVAPILKWARSFCENYGVLALDEIALAIDPEMAARLQRRNPEVNPYGKLAAIKIAEYFHTYRQYTAEKMSHAQRLLKKSQQSETQKETQAPKLEATTGLESLISQFLSQHTPHKKIAPQNALESVARAYQAWNDRSTPEAIRYFYITAELFQTLAKADAFQSIEPAHRDRLLAQAIDQHIRHLSKEEQHARARHRGGSSTADTATGSALVSDYARRRESLISYRNSLSNPEKSIILDNQEMAAVRITLQRLMVLELFTRIDETDT